MKDMAFSEIAFVFFFELGSVAVRRQLVTNGVIIVIIAFMLFAKINPELFNVIAVYHNNVYGENMFRFHAC